MIKDHFLTSFCRSTSYITSLLFILLFRIHITASQIHINFSFPDMLLCHLLTQYNQSSDAILRRFYRPRNISHFLSLSSPPSMPQVTCNPTANPAFFHTQKPSLRPLTTDHPKATSQSGGLSHFKSAKNHLQGAS